MSTKGKKKAVCKWGHVAPERFASGACKQCQREAGKERYQRFRNRIIQQVIAYGAAFPEKRRDQQRAVRLGVSVSEVRAVISRADGKCEACSLPLRHEQMCVDHCHASGILRGVLCRFCNALEGMLNKKKDRVRLVTEYLARAEIRIADEIARREKSK